MSALPTADLRYRPGRRGQRVLLSLAALGGAAFVAGLFLAPQQAWTGFLMGFVWLAQLGLAGVAFLAALYLASAGWATALRRIPEAMAATLPWCGLLGLLLIVGVPSLYEWSHAAAVAEDPVLAGKSSYLSPVLFAVRLVAFFLLWVWFARVFIRRSRLQDQTGGDPGAVRRNLVTAALFLAVFAITWSLASFDWLMSLEPHWFSTIYALYTLCGIATSGLAAGIVILAAVRRAGPLRAVVHADHLHDLGKLLLAFACFWGYIWYCQYMLIWYGGIPEETSWYLARSEGPWGSLMLVNLVLNWAVPFLLLLPRRSKRSEPVLVRVAWVVLVGHAVDLYLLVGPPLMGEHPHLRVWEAGPLVGCVALFFYLALRALAQGQVVPARDPLLPESLAYHS